MRDIVVYIPVKYIPNFYEHLPVPCVASSISGAAAVRISYKYIIYDKTVGGYTYIRKLRLKEVIKRKKLYKRMNLNENTG